jgi:hypothetical protein
MRDALVELLGKPTVEPTALFIPMGIYPFPAAQGGMEGDLRGHPRPSVRPGLDVNRCARAHITRLRLFSEMTPRVRRRTGPSSLNYGTRDTSFGCVNREASRERIPPRVSRARSQSSCGSAPGLRRWRGRAADSRDPAGHSVHVGWRRIAAEAILLDDGSGSVGF